MIPTPDLVAGAARRGYPILLRGGQGSGKTSLAYAVAATLGACVATLHPGGFLAEVARPLVVLVEGVDRIAQPGMLLSIPSWSSGVYLVMTAQTAQGLPDTFLSAVARFDLDPPAVAPAREHTPPPPDPLGVKLCPGCAKEADPDEFGEDGAFVCGSCFFESLDGLPTVRELADRDESWGTHDIDLAAWSRAVVERLGG